MSSIGQVNALQNRIQVNKPLAQFFARYSTWMVIALAALLRLINLGYPAKLAFDETYYVKDAWSLWNTGAERAWPADANTLFESGHVDSFLPAPAFVVHPPLGKWIIGFGMWLVGPTNPVGWRIATAVLGIASVWLIMLIAKRLLKSQKWALAAGFLMAIDGHAIVLARTALLDGILAFFVLLAFYFLLRDRARVDLAVVTWRRPWLLASALALGASMAVKWSGLYFLAAFGLYLVISEYLARRRSEVEQFTSVTIKQGLREFLIMVPTALGVYVLSWLGWILGSDGYERNSESNWFTSLIHYHQSAYGFHVGLNTPHSYASNPITWLFALRPTSFFYEGQAEGVDGCQLASGCSSAITALGNPLIWWPAALSLFFLLVWYLRQRDRTAGLILLGVLAGYVPWLFFMQRTVFQFYSIAFLPWMILALLYVVKIYLRLAEPKVAKSIKRGFVIYLAAVFGLSMFYLPIWNGTKIPYGFWLIHMWLPSWI